MTARDRHLRIGALFVRAALLISLSCAHDAHSQLGAGTDGQYNADIGAALDFRCQDLHAHLAYRQERIRSAPDLADSLRVRLTRLSVGGRAVPAADFERAAALARSFAWVNEVHGTCYAGRITIALKGTPLEPFVASLSGPERPTPALVTRTITLSVRGIEAIQ